MSDTQPLHFFSHSRADSDEMCRRKRYYGSDFGEGGIQALQGGWDAEFGNMIHGPLKELATEGSINFTDARSKIILRAIEYGMDQIAARDWGALGEGLLRGFVRAVWPALMAEYDLVEAEKMYAWMIKQGYVFRWRQDILLQSKFNGELTYIDYKTTSSDDDKWIASWAKHPQLHTSMYARRMLDGVAIQQAKVIGFYKGYKDKKEGLIRSPFVYGWVNREYPMSPEYSYEYKRTKGWERFSVAEEFPDLQEWVASMPMDLLTKQYPSTGPIFARDDVAQKWFRQQLIREGQVKDALYMLRSATNEGQITNILDLYFRQNFTKCRPAWGFSCEFESICWQPWVEADPLGSGLYKKKDHSYENE